jgi:hypothetical protein
MDARGMQRLLEKTQALAESTEHVGLRNAETMQREPRLSDLAKSGLAPLYREHAFRLTRLYCKLGLALCETLQPEAEDDAARGQLDLFRANFASLDERAAQSLRDLAPEARLGP